MSFLPILAHMRMGDVATELRYVVTTDRNWGTSICK